MLCEEALICSQNNGESAGFGINGNSITLFNAMDSDAMVFVREDSFAAGSDWKLTKTASIKELSDRRLKTNIKHFRTENILDKIMDIKG